jgi:hypothetical protein
MGVGCWDTVELGRASDRLAGSDGFAHGLRAGAEQTQTQTD